MAEVDFGDRELFEQLDGDDGPQPVHLRFDEAEDSGLQEQLTRCEETIEQLRAENILSGYSAHTCRPVIEVRFTDQYSVTFDVPHNVPH